VAEFAAAGTPVSGLATYFLRGRIAPSHARPSAEVATVGTPVSGLSVYFYGNSTTSLTRGVDTRSEAARLVGFSANPAVGVLKLSGEIRSERGVVPGLSQAQGTLGITSRRNPGELTLSLTGPAAELTSPIPTNSHLTFTVDEATGLFAPLAGGHGTADLDAQAKLPAPKGLAHRVTGHGKFTLLLTSA
jgi:hypothetical protein